MNSPYGNVEHKWQFVKSVDRPTETRGAALLIPGLNSSNRTVDELAELLLEERFDVHRLLLTQDMQFLRSMTPRKAEEVLAHARDETLEQARRTGGECIAVMHSFPCLANSSVTLNEGGSPFDKEFEFSPPYRIENSWHRLGSIMGRLPLPKCILSRIPINSWNPHSPDDDPLEHTRQHSHVPLSAYQTLFQMYLKVRDRGVGKSGEKFVAIDTKDELVDSAGMEAFLDQQKPRGLRFLLHKFTRAPFRGKRYHHNTTESEPHIEDSSPWWSELRESMQTFLRNEKSVAIEKA